MLMIIDAREKYVKILEVPADDDNLDVWELISLAILDYCLKACGN